MIRTARTLAAIVGGLAVAVVSLTTAEAAVISTYFNSPLSSTPVSFAFGSFGTVSFTSVTTGSGPGAAVATSGTAQVTTIFGQVADYGSDTVFDGSAEFASFSTPTTIPSSAADDFIGLAYTDATGLRHLGYAEVSGSSLVGIAYETLAETSIAGSSITASTAVPEPASVALMLAGIAGLGVIRRRSSQA